MGINSKRPTFTNITNIFHVGLFPPLGCVFFWGGQGGSEKVIQTLLSWIVHCLIGGGRTLSFWELLLVVLKTHLQSGRGENMWNWTKKHPNKIIPWISLTGNSKSSEPNCSFSRLLPKLTKNSWHETYWGSVHGDHIHMQRNLSTSSFGKA